MAETTEEEWSILASFNITKEDVEWSLKNDPTVEQFMAGDYGEYVTYYEGEEEEQQPMFLW